MIFDKMAFKLNRYFVINAENPQPYWSEIYAASKALASRYKTNIYHNQDYLEVKESINEADYPEGCKHVITINHPN